MNNKVRNECNANAIVGFEWVTVLVSVVVDMVKRCMLVIGSLLKLV
ncbi:hypothetical protein SLEP1_g43814 [Rubroshorea leprosula]|uniref:Uncharacterized protein n=1 Tax=Rubroshorea leprosula TaxID=152421 RepID=A0AAV5LEI6_9ROSI|nr:hypothetical protein SLEP1_g43814 [Rubroshorea leprosula]